MPEILAAVALPGCKSSSQRALMLTAVAAGESRIEGLSDCQDAADLLAALQALGVEAEPDPRAGGGPLRMRGKAPAELASKAGDAPGIPVGEGASTLRFLLALTAAGRGTVSLRPAAALAARPHGELLEILRSWGAVIEAETDAIGPRLRVRGCGGFGARAVELGPLQSSQTLSALWLAAGDAPMSWRLRGGASSQGYLRLTARMLRQARGEQALVEREAGRWWEQSAGYGARADLRVLADPSAVIFFAVAAVLLQRPVLLARNWNPDHADAALLERLRAEEWIGWSAEARGVLLTPGPSARARELVLDLDAAPDSGPALAVLAAHLPAGGRFSGLDRLRIKESDRVQAMLRLAEACGATASVGAGGMQIRCDQNPARLGEPAPCKDVTLVTAGDHRTAMAAGIAALLHPGLQPDNRACVAKSFPQFWAALAPLQP